MRSTMRLMSAGLLMLALTGCTVFGGGRPLVLAPDAPCADLVPPSWIAEDVHHAPDPAAAPTEPVSPAANASYETWSNYWHAKYDNAFAQLKAWIGFGVAEAQNVENEHGRVVATHQIVSGCEKRDAAAIKRLARGSSALSNKDL